MQEKHSKEFKPPKIYQNRWLVLSELIDAISNKTKVNVLCAYQKSSIQNLFGLHLGIQATDLQPEVVNINLSLKNILFQRLFNFSFFSYFFFIYLHHDPTQNESQKTKLWAKFPLNQSCFLMPIASGFSTSKSSSWESCLFVTALLLDLTYTWKFSWILPTCSKKPPSVPPVRQDFISTEKAQWHKIHGVENDDRTEVYEQEGPTYIKGFGCPVVRECRTLFSEGFSLYRL